MNSLLRTILTIGVLVCAAVAAKGADVQLQGGNAWPPAVHDGDFITFTYKVNSSAARPIYLGGGLTTPGGMTLADNGDESAATVPAEAGSQTLQRSFLVNVPPGSADGAYDATWQLSWDGGLSPTLTAKRGVAVMAPVEVRVPILMYHKFGDKDYSAYWVRTSTFEQQLCALRERGYTAITAEDLLKIRAGSMAVPAKPVMITVDDGYENLFTDALPVLKKPHIQMPVVAFISTGRLGGDNSWDEGAMEAGEPVIRHLTWDEVEQLHKSGYVDIESHTVNHVALPSVSIEQAMREVTESKRDLEAHLHKDVRFFAYPYFEGQWDPRYPMLLWKAGYFGAFVGQNRVETDSANKWALRRILVGEWVTAGYDKLHPENFLFGPAYLNDPDVPREPFKCRTLEPIPNPNPNPEPEPEPSPTPTRKRSVAR